MLPICLFARLSLVVVRCSKPAPPSLLATSSTWSPWPLYPRCAAAYCLLFMPCACCWCWSALTLSPTHPLLDRGLTMILYGVPVLLCLCTDPLQSLRVVPPALPYRLLPATNRNMGASLGTTQSITPSSDPTN